MNDTRLLRHLTLAVLLELAVLVALWWVFVRDALRSVTGWEEVPDEGTGH